jgi:hypothetical protein
MKFIDDVQKILINKRREVYRLVDISDIVAGYMFEPNDKLTREMIKFDIEDKFGVFAQDCTSTEEINNGVLSYAILFNNDKVQLITIKF